MKNQEKEKETCKNLTSGENLECFAYSKMRKTYRKPHQFKRKRSIFKNRFFWLGIIIFVFIGSLFYFLFFSEVFQVKNIIVTGEEKVSKESIRLLIEKKLENKILFFKTKSIFLVNLKETKKDILNSFPQIAEVEINQGSPDSLNIVVVERLGSVNWCREESCFLLDSEGIIFEESQLNANLIKINDKQNITPFTLGERAIEGDFLKKILKIESKLKTGLRVPIEEFIIISEERLNVKTSENWEIYLNPKKDIDWQITKLLVVLEEKIPPETRKDLEYVDLRFGNFAPFKYRD